MDTEDILDRTRRWMDSIKGRDMPVVDDINELSLRDALIDIRNDRHLMEDVESNPDPSDEFIPLDIADVASEIVTQALGDLTDNYPDLDDLLAGLVPVVTIRPVDDDPTMMEAHLFIIDESTEMRTQAGTYPFSCEVQIQDENTEEYMNYLVQRVRELSVVIWELITSGDLDPVLVSE